MDHDSLSQYAVLLQELQSKSVEHSHSLPGLCYTDEAVTKFEKAWLRREWFCLGRADQISLPGEFFTTTLLNESLLVVRGDDDVVRVMANVCRHRNMKVATGCGKKRVFVCPYHAWSYGRDGRLVNAPHMPEEKIGESVRGGLTVLRSEIWQGFIFVNFDYQAADLGPQLGGLDDVLKNYHTDEMHHFFVREEVWRVNWKCLVENFLEGYHLSIVHKDTLHNMTPTRLCEKFTGEAAYTGYKSYYPDTAPDRGQMHADLTGRERRCSTLFCIYPGLLVSQSGSLLVYLTIHPLDVDAVQVRWGAASYESTLTDEQTAARIGLWDSINQEDREKLEVLQQTLSSEFAGMGPLAPEDYEGTIWDFYRYLAQRTLSAHS